MLLMSQVDYAASDERKTSGTIFLTILQANDKNTHVLIYSTCSESIEIKFLELTFKSFYVSCLWSSVNFFSIEQIYMHRFNVRLSAAIKMNHVT